MKRIHVASSVLTTLFLALGVAVSELPGTEAFIAPGVHKNPFVAFKSLKEAQQPPSITSLWNFQDDDVGVADLEQNLLVETNQLSASHDGDRKVASAAKAGLKSVLKNISAKFGVVAAVVSLALTLSLAPLPAHAARSGGRMGGSYSPSVRMPPTTRVTPNRGSYSSGYSRGFGSGYSSGYMARPGVTVVSPFYYSPFARPYYSPYGTVAVSRGPPIIPIIFFGAVALAVANAVRTSNVSGSFWDNDSSTVSPLGPGTSVLQVSVALNVPDRDDPSSVLSALTRLSETAKTDSRVGIQNLSSQVALELLRRQSSIVSAVTDYKHYDQQSLAQRDFNARSVQERSKFEEETVSKYGGVNYGSATNNPSRGQKEDSKATMAVVTLILAIDGDSTKVPQIRSINDVVNALRKVAADSQVEDCLQSLEILWTPESRSETLTQRDVIVDYPELRSV